MIFCKNININDKNDNYEIFNINGLLCLGNIHCIFKAKPGSENCRPEEEQPGIEQRHEDMVHRIDILQKSANNVLSELVQLADTTPKLRNRVINTISKIRNDFGLATKNLIDNN